MEIGTFFLIVTFAYSVGVFLYDLLPGKLAMQPWRVVAYPFAAIIVAEGLGTLGVPLGPIFGGFHWGAALVASVVGVLLDWLITVARHPAAVETMETRSTPLRA